MSVLIETKTPSYYSEPLYSPGTCRIVVGEDSKDLKYLDLGPYFPGKLVDHSQSPGILKYLARINPLESILDDGFHKISFLHRRRLLGDEPSEVSFS
jgi:hypothetical protein